MADQPGTASNFAGGTVLAPDAHFAQIAAIPVSVSVTLCQRRMKLRELLSLAPGSFIPFEASCRQPLELQVDGRTIALGEAVQRERQLGLRLNNFEIASTARTRRH